MLAAARPGIRNNAAAVLRSAPAIALFTEFTIDNVLVRQAGATVFSDDFNRTGPAVGNGWTTDPGIAIASNVVDTTINGAIISRDVAAGECDLQIDVALPGGETVGNGLYVQVGRLGTTRYWFVVDLLAFTPQIRVRFQSGPDFSTPTTTYGSTTVMLGRAATWRFTYDGVSFAAYCNGTRLLHSGLRSALLDDFHRTNANPASPSPQGYAYTSPIGTAPKISSNTMTGSSPEWVGVTNLDGDPGDFDWTYQFISGTPPAGSTDYIDLMFRVQDGSNRCFVQVSGGGIGMYKVISGTQSTIATATQSLYTGGAGHAHTMRVQGSGNTITAYLDGTLLITATVTALTTAPGVGVHHYAQDGTGTLLRAT